MSSLSEELTKIQQAYDGVLLEDAKHQTKLLLRFLQENKSKVRLFENTTKVLARPVKAGEQIKVDLKKGRQIVRAKDFQWLVQENGKQTLLEGAQFEFIYDFENPLKGSGVIKLFQPRKRNFFGTVHEGKSTFFAPPQSKGAIVEIFEGFVIGGPNPEQFEKYLIAIDPETFEKNYALKR
jgi:hypothetical protein